MFSQRDRPARSSGHIFSHLLRQDREVYRMHAQRRVFGARDLGRELDDALEQRGKRQLRGKHERRLDKDLLAPKSRYVRAHDTRG